MDLPKFLICDKPQIEDNEPRTFVFHTQFPRFLLETFLCFDKSEVDEYLSKFESGVVVKSEDGFEVFALVDQIDVFEANTPEQVRELMKEAALTYLKDVYGMEQQFGDSSIDSFWLN